MAPLRYPAILCSLCYAVGTDLDVVVVKVAMSETREVVPASCECACRNLGTKKHISQTLRNHRSRSEGAQSLAGQQPGSLSLPPGIRV